MAIHQIITVKSNPRKVYDALTSAGAFRKVTGAPTEIADGEGGAFSCFGGHIVGRHLELDPANRIVQAWRAVSWPEGAYSIVRFDLAETGDTTTIKLEHAGFPDGAAEHLEAGWHKMYWEPLKAYLEQ